MARGAVWYPPPSLDQSGGEVPRRMRELCLALPETAELLSHGTPSFGIVGRRQFATYWNNHHADGRLALWCAAPPGAQGALVAAKPDHYFVPPYVGYRGWVGLHLNRGLAWDDIAAAVEDAYLTVAPEKLIRAHLKRTPA